MLFIVDVNVRGRVTFGYAGSVFMVHSTVQHSGISSSSDSHVEMPTTIQEEVDASRRLTGAGYGYYVRLGWLCTGRGALMTRYIDDADELTNAQGDVGCRTQGGFVFDGDRTWF